MRNILAVHLSLLLAACGGTSATDVKQPYPAFSETTKVSYVRSLPGGGQTSLSAQVAGTKTVGGEDYSRFEIVPVTGGERAEVWGNLISSDQVEFIGGEFDSPAGGSLGISSYASFELDEPLRVNLGGGEGDTQSIDANAQVVLGGAGNPAEAAQVTGELVLAEKNVGVDTALGYVSGCDRYELAVNIPLLFAEPTPVSAQLWHSRRLGLLKATFGPPLEGLGLDFTGSSDEAELGGGWASTQAIGLVNSSGKRLDLSTYDRRGEFDADKDTHAKMLLELRWADPELARSSEQPPAQVEFGTVFGYYPHELLPSERSFFHPEENQEGYTYWIAYVDQAAKNESENGIAYRIDVSCPACASPLRVTSRIVYKLFEGE